MGSISRAEYVASFGPTAGDRIRLADTNLVIEVEEDRCVGGDEAAPDDEDDRGRRARPTSSSRARSCSTTGAS